MSLSLAQKMERLAALRFFRDFEAEALKILAFSTIERRFRPGDLLLRGGQQVDAALVLASGFAEGDGVIVEPGAAIGLRAMLAQGRASSDIKATEDVVALELPHDLIWRVLREFPASAVAARDAQAEDLKNFVESADRIRRRFTPSSFKI